MIGFIGFKIGDTFLDLAPNTSVGIELSSPLFARNETPGLITYPITAPPTTRNRLTLGFPDVLSTQGVGKIEFPCDFYIMGVRWKSGIMRYLGYGPAGYKLNFKSDAGDFASRTRDTSLKSIPYQDQIFYQEPRPAYPASAYALFPVKNTAFYGDKRPDFPGYQNYYSGNFYGAHQCLTPFPYVRYVLQAIMDHYGYNLAGAWLSESLNALCIYSNYEYQGTNAGSFSPADHLPDLRVGEFMQALRNLFGLAYLFNATTKTITIARLNDIIADTAYIDWTEKAENSYEDEAVDNGGYTLKQALEPADELNKTLSTDWAEFKVGSGREEIPTAAGSLHMIREQDQITTSRNWFIPATQQPGTSPEYSTGENKPTLRILQYYGMAKDSANQDYPLGTAVQENWAGAGLGGRSLRYAGPDGLYANNWKAWLDAMGQARPVERSARLDISDLVGLDPTRKIMIDGLKYFYSKLTFSVSLKEGIGKVRGSFLKVNV